ncbi:MAG: hypothetical protein IJY25_02550 [Bacilli bacterium]|nr:hypothetical protein [Bacilli bacterium]
MKNKKVVIIISIILIIGVAIAFGIYNFYSSYMFNEDGTIAGGSKESFIENVQKLEDEEDKITLINFAVEHGIITEKEAKELLESN